MTARALTCPHCGGPINFHAPFCAYCGAWLSWQQPIDLEPGDVLSHVDVGEQISLKQRRWYRWKVVCSSIRNACVSLRGRALDAYGEVGAFVRWNAEGSFHTGYNFRVYPALRSFCCERWIMGKEDRVMAPVHDWTHSPCIAPPGADNEIEVRFADEVFQFLVNGTRVGGAFDATFGFGQVAWYAGSNDGPAEVRIESLTARRVL